MNRQYLNAGLFLLSFLLYHSASASPDPLSDLHQRLASLRSISYTYSREGNYRSDGHFHQYEGVMFFDFTNKANPIGADCYFENDDYIAVYNGTELFHCDKRTREIRLGVNPPPEEIESELFLPCSLLSIKNALPWVIADKSIRKVIKDTLIGERKALMIRLGFDGKTVSAIGKPWPILKIKELYYSIFVDPENGLPFQVLMHNGENNDYFQARFSNIVIDKKLKGPEAFYYSTYLGEYQMSKKSTKEKLISPGSMAPDFRLPTHVTQAVNGLSSSTTPFTLLVFSIVNCGYSQEMISRLNKIHALIPPGRVTVIIINPYDPENSINKYITLTQPDPSYRILVEGKAVAKQYGVNGYPTAVLLDTGKKVVYASPGFDEAVLLSLIK